MEALSAVLKTYLKSVSDISNRGDAREESYYSALEELLDAYADTTDRKGIDVRTLPKRTEAGNPDFRVWDGQQHIIGYIEAKNPETEDLDQIEDTEQLQRYLHTFPNLILTNFLEFRLYRDGEITETVRIGRPLVLKLGKVPPLENAEGLLSLLDRFFGFSLPASYTAESLALELAKRTRFLRDVVAEEISEEQAQQSGDLLGFYEAFQKYLIAKLRVEDFADLYAQTVTYGLFAARTRARNGFTRRLAFDHIPKTIGILRDVFRFISSGDLPKQIEWVVDDISEVLAVADAGGLLDRYYHEGEGSDPIVHFYETFLAEYDPAERERRGVYYTPEPVVSYIVRSLHLLLKRQFKRAEGLASEGVTLLDPAAGTMTFVALACQEAVREFERKYGEGGREEFIRRHILQNYYAFELMMAPYAVGHLKMSFFLEELGHCPTDEERFKFYLTNTLEMEDLEQTHIPGMASLAQESRLAGEVKKQRPILVILGNPPYSGHSSNRGDWILGLIKDYRQMDGKPLGERNPKWLQDDYVKFLRFAQWKIDQEGQGVVGMITNHSYLDNPTFRAMRLSLMRTFDEIYLLDLHGNALKREKAPDGGKEENVFDIRQGVAIAFFVKTGAGEGGTGDVGRKGGLAKVHHAEIWGLREGKYEYLREHDVESTKWQEIHPKAESYFFVPRDEALEGAYHEFVRVDSLFPVNSMGIQSHRDDLVMDSDPASLKQRLRMFCDPKLPDEVISAAFQVSSSRGWQLGEKRRALRESGDWASKVVRFLYRPFDRRWICYHPDIVDRPRCAVMRNMMMPNLALNTVRQTKAVTWRHALVSDTIAPAIYVEIKDGSSLFPLYIYPHSPPDGTLVGVSESERTPNLCRPILAKLETAYNLAMDPEAVLHYVYAILYAETYRRKYGEFLKRDFPRIPFTADAAIFKDLATLGKRLVDLHLLRSAELDPPAARFEGKGDNRIERARGLRYEPKTKRVYINANQYFGAVSRELWEYQIGGYQVLDKWLKDRRDRHLGLDEIKTYCHIVTAISRTIALQKEIDGLYPAAEKKIIPLKFA